MKRLSKKIIFAFGILGVPALGILVFVLRGSVVRESASLRQDIQKSNAMTPKGGRVLSSNFPSAPLRSPAANTAGGSPKDKGGLKLQSAGQDFTDLSPLSLLNGAEIISTQTTEVDSQGKFKKLYLAKRSDLKYPMLRVEQVFKQASPGVEPHQLQEVGMVGDHVLVKMQPGYRQEDLERVLSHVGGEIRKAIPISELYLVSFEAKDFGSLQTMIQKLNRSSGVAYSEPDFVRLQR